MLCRRLAFAVAARAALGNLVSEAQLDEMYPHFNTMTRGAFASARSCPAALPRCTVTQPQVARARGALSAAAA